MSSASNVSRTTVAPLLAVCAALAESLADVAEGLDGVEANLQRAVDGTLSRTDAAHTLAAVQRFRAAVTLQSGTFIDLATALQAVCGDETEG